jgi:hypothetical protein
MGSLLSKVIGAFAGSQPCESFLKDFPTKIGKVSLPSIVLDGIGLTCSGGNRSAPLINMAGNVAGMITLYVANTNMGFMKSLGKMIPKLFTDDEATNATIFEYLVLNIVLFAMDSLSSTGKTVYDGKTAGEKVQNCLSNPIQCAKDAVAYLGQLKSPTCKAGLESDAGLCYESCKAGYKGVGPVCWSATPPASEGWRDDGAFIHQSYARPQHWQIDLPTPAGAKRTAACTMDFGPYGGVYTNCSDTRITNAKLGEDLSQHFGDGYHKTALCTVQKGGVVTSCELYGQGCEEGYEKHGSMCYEKPKPGFHCDLVTCYKDCPPNYRDIGISCAKDSYGRGVGKVPTQCPASYTYDGALVCGPTDEYMRHLQGDDSGSDSWTPWLIGGGIAAAGIAFLALRK